MVRRRTGSVTSFDVAKAAGVSQPTVSRAMRDMPSISAATRERIRQVAEDLGYVPSDAGRALSTRATRRVAILTEELTNPYYPELIQPLRTALENRGLRTVLVTDAANDRLTLDSLTDGSYDGIILTTTLRKSPLPRDLSERQVPHVLVNRVVDNSTSPSCAIDNALGARAVADLLVTLKHRRIGSLQGPLATSTGRERASALATALRGHDLHIERALNRRVPFDHNSAFDAALDMLQYQHPTAIACGNDVIAMGVLSAARHLGLAVPRDLTVIGFDDIPMSNWPLVGLTTVHCDLEALASSAISLLTASMDGTSLGGQTLRIAPHMVLRTTHAPTGG
ncbi:LacI family DNA-binding transcriptional regulator [Streptomyces canus]|uniref:LacI family DNA-binding transcriptional regulator n=1 Tax=Streptomyces canus TaxID=58343 RepID=UPI0036C9E1D5